MKGKKKRLLFGTTASLVALGAWQWPFDIPNDSVVLQYQSASPTVIQSCRYDRDKHTVLSGNTLKILVWNIYKQQRNDWLSALSNYTDGAQLVLLQEAQATPELLQYATQRYPAVAQVAAFSIRDQMAGVMTLSAVEAEYYCPLREREPWLKLPKSALVSVYGLATGQTLMVVNVHAVNFTVGVQAYRQQLEQVLSQIALHRGPVILAGDFNSWSVTRLALLRTMVKQMGLEEVLFPKGQRKKAFGYPLDHVFYRGLKVEKASVMSTDASDHNPLEVTFGF
ncbi:MAG: endonuclease/exonuclease/phosphatase family protein [Plesiomonas sp.]|uniref:endonuclease/exonuclease/phosphatase family protein n=1 Tax=Plesiomonas sp. TaxID=2486279 RepID=UPI003F39AB52